MVIGPDVDVSKAGTGYLGRYAVRYAWTSSHVHTYASRYLKIYRQNGQSSGYSRTTTTPATAGYVLGRGMLRPLLYRVYSTLSGVTGTLLLYLAERSKV